MTLGSGGPSPARGTRLVGPGTQTQRPHVLGAAPPEEVAQLAASLPANRWVWRTITEGSKGPLVARFARLRVMAVREGLPGPDVWLVLRHHVRHRGMEDVSEQCSCPDDAGNVATRERDALAA